MFKKDLGWIRSYETGEKMGIFAKPKLKPVNIFIGFGSVIFGCVWLAFTSWASGADDAMAEELAVQEKLGIAK